MRARSKWLEILLLLNCDDHLLEVVRCDMSFAATTSAVY